MQLYTDQTLITLLRSSLKKENNEALSHLYEKYYGGVARFVIDNSGTRDDAKDIFQDGLIVLCEKVKDTDFVWSSKLHTFLFAVCKNLWFKRLRKASNREVSTENIHELPVLDITFDDPYEDEKLQLTGMLEKLGGSCREVLILFYFRRFSMKEIAATMNLADEKVAKNKKARCMAKLRQLFMRSPDSEHPNSAQ